MKALDKALFKEIFNLYRDGLLNSNYAKRIDPRADFLTTLKQALLNRLPMKQRLLVRQVWSLSWQGLNATRAGKLREAAQKFDEARTSHNRNIDCRECHLLAATMLDAAEAYLDHVHGRFDQARSLMLRAMDADEELERDYGYDLLHIHRIQGAQNIARICLRERSWEEAFSLLGSAIAYIDGRRNSLPIHHSWKQERLQQIARGLHLLMLRQIANEAALSLRIGPRPSWEIFQDAVRLNEYKLTTQYTCPRVYRWLLAREAFAQEQHDNYIEHLRVLLPLGHLGVSSIWYSCVMDFVDFCKKLDTPISRFTMNAILKDTSKWPGLHPALRQKLPAAASN